MRRAKKRPAHPISLRIRAETRQKVRQTAAATGLTASYIYLSAIEQGLPTVARKLEGLRLSRRGEDDKSQEDEGKGASL